MTKYILATAEEDIQIGDLITVTVNPQTGKSIVRRAVQADVTK